MCIISPTPSSFSFFIFGWILLLLNLLFFNSSSSLFSYNYNYHDWLRPYASLGAQKTSESWLFGMFLLPPPPLFSTDAFLWRPINFSANFSLFSRSDSCHAASECRHIHFNDSQGNKVLVNHVISKHTVPTDQICRLKCYLHEDCTSYNTGPTSEKPNMVTCELNSGNRYHHPLDFVDKQGFSYRGIEVRKKSIIDWNWINKIS